MERNENDIFDELVRGKLANYTEAPEPEWIRSIQAKKTRAVNLYQLYRLMMIAVIVGAGIFAGIMLTPTQTVVRTQVQQPQQKQSQPATTRKAAQTTPAQQPTGEFATPVDQFTRTSYSGNTSSTPPSGARNAITTSAAKNTKPVSKGVSSRATSQNQTTITQPVTPVNNTLPTDDTKVVPGTTKEEVKQPDADKKDNSQTSAVPCKANFDYYTDYSGKFNFVQLEQLSENTTLTWTFGDGTTGNQKTESHVYQQSGMYEVTLTVANATSSCFLTKNIAYQNPNDKTTPISISGTVVAGSNILKNAPVELYKFDEQKGRFKSDQTLRTNQMGEYTLTLERNIRYMIKGYPTSESQHYAATYWGNTTELESATEIMVMPSENEHIMGYTIQLQYDEQDQVAENTIPLPSPETMAGSQQVFLVDGNNKIVSTGTVDQNGNYTFGPGVDAGDYKIVNPGNGSSATTSVTPDGKGLSGNLPPLGGNGNSSTSNDVLVYPNPASSIVTFGLTNDQNEVAIVVIMDAAGVERSRQKVEFNPGHNEAQYDISTFPPGIYYVMIFRNNKQVSSSRIVKQLADTGRQ